MKLLESKEELLAWEKYSNFLKLQLKRITKPGPFFVSKEKIEFEIKGRPWKGHAVLAGPKASQCVRKLKKDGLIFREGTCSRKGRDLTFGGPQLKDRYVKESEKTMRKLRLGYTLEHKKEEEEGA